MIILDPQVIANNRSHHYNPKPKYIINSVSQIKHYDFDL